MDQFWCYGHKYLSDIIPSILHTTATWLTVFLAVQRYVYVCVPNSVHLYCTPKTTRVAICSILMLSSVTVMPDLMAKQFSHFIYFDQHLGRHKRACRFEYPKWVEVIGMVTYYTAYLWIRAIMHFIPCTLLLIFTYKLGRTIKRAEIRKRSFILNQDGSERKHSTVSNNPVSCSGRSLYATNRMLSVICSVFLILEIPASVAFILQFLIGSGWLVSSQKDELAGLLNRLMIIRNLLIVLTSPIQFIIYCSMSEQFRITVRQLFTKRLLFVAQAQATFHGGKRYSLILVDVDSIERRNGGSKRNSRAVVSCEPREPSVKVEYPESGTQERRKMGKVGRQVSFKDRPLDRNRDCPSASIVTKETSPGNGRRLSTVIQEPASPDAVITPLVLDTESDSLWSQPTTSTLVSERPNGDIPEIRIELKECSTSNEALGEEGVEQ
ncbi:unnamed protein product, partial [Mesorhabditis spiculigera]